MYSCTGENKRKYEIIMTDTFSYNTIVQAALSNTPDNITVFAIGFGDASFSSMVMLARNITENAYSVEAKPSG